MLILPAIDLRGGQCVRLRQGDYGQETVFGADPAAMARRWVDEGAKYLHIVDLDGARAGRPVNSRSIRRIVQAAGVPCQLGGGLRTKRHIAAALRWGIERVVLGTRALKEPAWLEKICGHFPKRVVLGIDAKGGRVATAGWMEVSDIAAIDLAKRCSSLPLAALVYTDIARDGMLAGPNVDALAEMVKAVSLPVIASGGISTLDDIRGLSQLHLAGCIIGRALYEGRIQLESAISIAHKESDKR